MPTPFESFVNAELPKRISTNADPLSVPSGMVPVTTGVGLLTEFKPYSENGSVSLETIVSLISNIIIYNEVPTNSENNIFITNYPFITGSLMVYLNGIRLLPGIDNDFYELNQSSFIVADFIASDSIIVDYKRTL